MYHSLPLRHSRPLSWRPRILRFMQTVQTPDSRNDCFSGKFYGLGRRALLGPLCARSPAVCSRCTRLGENNRHRAQSNQVPVPFLVASAGCCSAAQWNAQSRAARHTHRPSSVLMSWTRRWRRRPSSASGRASAAHYGGGFARRCCRPWPSRCRCRSTIDRTWHYVSRLRLTVSGRESAVKSRVWSCIRRFGWLPNFPNGWLNDMKAMESMILSIGSSMTCLVSARQHTPFFCNWPTYLWPPRRSHDPICSLAPRIANHASAGDCCSLFCSDASRRVTCDETSM
ncbi:hypothetical protein BCR44DRAFT_1083881 [Catenaria anguillulae PL171]|uniref:Uncharacterized protein n=1 Tax=Catenaria anguillulae PL171 TaxID=765915 RepID=A0A1Y2HNK5_9FUNG|nr:hypothetical protein BCR44DRAFT_1083881 [Catenaria anguillulae PL171]